MRERTQEKRFTDKQIELANSINILDYAKSRGYPVIRVTPHSYKIPGYGGLYIHSNGLKWNRFSADVGGGTIQFVVHMENKTWVEAIKELLDISDENTALYVNSVREIKDNKEVKNRVFTLPEKNDTYKHLFAYLIDSRKIDKQLVYDLVDQNKIYENKYYKSCVFVGYNKNGEAKYASIRGTNPKVQYRKDVSGSDKSYPFVAMISSSNVCKDSTFSSNKLYVFESPIDLMSYLTLIKLHKIKDFNAHCISLGGVCDIAIREYLKEYPEIYEITLCLDNDKAGRFACEELWKKYNGSYKIRMHLPQNKDFNDELAKFVGQNESEMEEFDLGISQ